MYDYTVEFYGDEAAPFNPGESTDEAAHREARHIETEIGHEIARLLDSIVSYNPNVRPDHIIVVASEAYHRDDVWR